MSDGLELREVVADADGGHRATVLVASDAPWFAGHFPGEPVLPAMAQIGLVDRLHRAAGRPGSATALPNLRLAGPVHPGDRLTVHLGPADDHGRATLRLDKEDGTVTRGSMRWGEPQTPPTPPLDPEEPDTVRRHAGRGSRPHSPSPTLLPHTPPARLADKVLEVSATHILCRGSIPPANASVRDGTAGPWMALELAAQAAGLLQAAAEERGEIRVGYIVRIRNARFHRPTLPAAIPLLAHVHHDGGGGPLTLYRLRVELDGTVVVTGSLGTFVPTG